MLRFMVLHHECSHIRKSADITPICGSPQLIAACHVLLRLLMPRHSPYALVRLNFFSFFTILVLISAELLEFLQIKFGIIFSRERFFPFTLLSYSTSVKSFLPLLERPILEFLLSLYSSLKSVLLSVRFYSYFALFGFQ